MKKEGHAEFRVPLVPLFKVCDIRRNLSDKWKKSYTQSAYVIADCSKPSERSSRENQWDVSLIFDI